MKDASPPAGGIAQNSPLTYTIHFQNTGNDVAYNILIVDTLDNNLDPGSVEVLQSSHPVQFNMGGAKILNFRFNNIMLPDSGSNLEGSKGFVKFRVDQKPNIDGGTEIKNDAYIYFDFNPAIQTNELVHTVIVITGTPEENLRNDDMIVYPNPASDMLTIDLAKCGTSSLVVLTDLSGRPVMTIPGGTMLQLDLSGLSEGVYLLKVETDKGIYNRRIVLCR
jgi:uncharacterized repeat protein (TIGR01451 family)